MEKMNRIEAIVRDRSTLYPCCVCPIEPCDRNRQVTEIHGNPTTVAHCANIKSSHYQEKIEAIGKER